MSFKSKVKKELCSQMPQDECCKKAQCYGIFLFSKLALKIHESYLSLDDPYMAIYIAEALSENAGIILDINTAITRMQKKITVSLPSESDKTRLAEYFGHTGRETTLRIKKENIKNECCKKAFLRGVFIACGGISDPNKEYRIEFVPSYVNLFRDLIDFLDETGIMEIRPYSIKRRGNYVLYIRDSEQIADLLTYMGASNCAMEIMQVKMLKNEKNNVNRKVNFEIANMDKTLSASVKQIDAIKKILEINGVDSLPEDLREIAKMRIENPEMTLSEIANKLNMSRSGVNHRFRRIIEIASEMN